MSMYDISQKPNDAVLRSSYVVVFGLGYCETRQKPCQWLLSRECSGIFTIVTVLGPDDLKPQCER